MKNYIKDVCYIILIAIFSYLSLHAGRTMFPQTRYVVRFVVVPYKEQKLDRIHSMVPEFNEIVADSLLYVARDIINNFERR